MNAKDLNKSHYKIWEKNPEISQSKEHTKLSIQFTIDVLEEIWDREDWGEDLQSKIQELKQYLDEKV